MDFSYAKEIQDQIEMAPRGKIKTDSHGQSSLPGFSSEVISLRDLT